MKKVVFLMYLCFGISHAQIINFPDANFKARLLQASPITNTVAYGSTGYIKIDANNNGEIEQSEALMVTNLNVIGQNISNLEGLQYFTNLTVLMIYNNSISSVNLSPLTQLVNLTCYNNQLTSLDFSNLPNLKSVYCGNNLLTSLDFSYNPLFQDLGWKNNPNLTSIKFKNNHQQLFGSQTILNECWTGCPNLNYICADAFEIPALQSYLAGCGITQAITIDSACPLLGNDGFEKEKFTIFPNPFDSDFTISFDNLVKDVKLELFNLLGQKIYEETIENKNKHTLDINELSKGTYLLKISDKQQTITKKIIKN